MLRQPARPVFSGPKALVVGCLALALTLAATWLLSRGDLPLSISRITIAQPDRPLAVPTPEPQIFKPLTPEEALAANAALPVSKTPVEAAPSFRMSASGPAALIAASETDCLAAAVYYEAASESEQGQRAVAQVVLNRVRHPSFPHSVCGVVYQGSERSTGCQFTFTCDGSLARKPSREGWERALRIARAALNGAVEPSVGMATHYHTVWVLPYWAPTLNKITTIGAHIFYSWKGFWGRRAAFSASYASETLSTQLIEPESVIDGNVDPLALAPGFSPERTRLLADENVSAHARQQGAGAAAPARTHLVADEKPGTLVADEDSEDAGSFSEKSIAPIAQALAVDPKAPRLAIP